MRLKHGEIFDDDFLTNLLLSQMVEEFLNSVSMRRTYKHQENSGTFLTCSGHWFSCWTIVCLGAHLSAVVWRRRLLRVQAGTDDRASYAPVLLGVRQRVGVGVGRDARDAAERRSAADAGAGV